MVFSNSISYVHKKSLNLDILWKDFEMKLGEIIGDYKTILFSKGKDMFCESYELLKTLC